MATTTRRATLTGTRLVARDPALLRLDALAREAGIHPDLARRLVALGLIEPAGGTATAPLFRRRDAPLLARAMRLRRDLGLNYPGAVLACELLARIEEYERRLRSTPTHTEHEVITWTRTV
jgi:MerR HTH family regulatory protein